MVLKTMKSIKETMQHCKFLWKNNIDIVQSFLENDADNNYTVVVEDYFYKFKLCDVPNYESLTIIYKLVKD